MQTLKTAKLNPTEMMEIGEEIGYIGRVPFNQNFRKFRFKIEWKG